MAPATKVKITYLQMFARPEWSVPPPREGLAIIHAKKPTVAYYRFLYDTVGRDYDRPRCKKLSDTVGRDYDRPRCSEGEIELVHFGLVSEFIGQGLGRYFL